jgi:hypothetical protein
MTTIWINCLLVPFILFPLLATLFFGMVVRDRRRRDIMTDLSRHRVWDTKDVEEIRTVDQQDVEETFRDYYDLAPFWLPAGLLTFLYLVAATVGASLLSRQGGDNSCWPYSTGFVTDVSPVLVAVVSVYLFNMQHILRRLYLTDLNAHVFWGCLYRTMLVIGLSTVLAFPYPSDAGAKRLVNDIGYGPFFAVGFLATDLLFMILDRAQKVFGLGKSSAPEAPLSLIRGINLWNEYRLGEEGIENVQQLATCDVIDLAVKTHYPLKTLLDWVDQAILLHNLGTVAQVDTLREKALITSAIDFAWMAPENDEEGKTTIADRVAELLGLKEELVRDRMNSLYEDANLQFLWYLWQSRPEFRRHGHHAAKAENGS